ALVRRNEPVDMLTVRAELETAGALDEAGGAGSLAILVDFAATAVNTEMYLARISDLSTRRALLGLGLDLTREAADRAGAPPDVLLGDALQRLVSLETLGHTGIVTPATFAAQLSTAKATDGLETGITLLDDLCDGLQPGNLVVIAGRPGMGK